MVDGHILAREAVIATTLQYKDGDERRIDLKNLQNIHLA
jgi:cation transport regulator ChaB